MRIRWRSNRSHLLIAGKPFVGDSPSMRRLLEAVARIAPREVPVLISGETGTGKELIASLLHAQSKRSSGPLVILNCAAIPVELAEAELFGHARGAFSGAVQSRRGFFAEADGGTLMLDEIGELPPQLQAKLLRALQDGEIQPVGAGRLLRVDVRVVACTNRDLAAEAGAGHFRDDLYYRLAVVELLVPPLRERREDIPALAAEFARHYGEQFGQQQVRLSPALVEMLCQFDWPGNVRELENAIARWVAFGGERDIRLGTNSHGPSRAREQAPDGADGMLRAATSVSLREQVESLERQIIAEAMDVVSGNQSEAARRLGISRGSLLEKLRKYDLRARRNPGERRVRPSPPLRAVSKLMPACADGNGRPRGT
jgi:two-component system response regulator AtoC